jgi:hypothetical protein
MVGFLTLFFTAIVALKDMWRLMDVKKGLDNVAIFLTGLCNVMTFS